MNKKDSLIPFTSTTDILQDMREIIEGARESAYQAVNVALVQRNWLLGHRIAEEELRGGDRAEYGLEIIKKLSKELTVEFGKGFSKTNLYNFYMFYKTFPEIFHAASGKSQTLLSWTHYRTLLQVKDDKARVWYSVMHGSEQLFASKYKLYLPTEEELRAEIEAQKAVFYLQQKEDTQERERAYGKKT